MKQSTFYFIKVFSGELNFELKINDVKLVEETKGNTFSTSFYINEWVFNGPNILSVEYKNEEAESFSYIEIELQVTSDKESFKEIYSLHLDHNNLFKKTSHLHTFFVDEMESKSPLTNLPNVSKNDISNIYKKSFDLYCQFGKKDIEGISSACKFRMEEYDNVYQRLPSTSEINFRKLLNKVFSSEVMAKYPDTELRIKLEAGGKLANLISAEDGLPAIVSMPPDYSGTRSFMFYWAIDNNGEPFIYR